MRLVVKTLNGWAAEFSIEPDKTIDLLKEMVIKELGNTQLTISQVKLLYQDKEITKHTVSECGIQEGGVLKVVIKDRETFQILVEYNCRKIQLAVESTELVENVKEMLHQQEGFQVHHQTLFYNRRKIVGGRLNHHSICSNSTIQLQVKLQVLVRDTTGTIHTFDVNHDTTVDDLKLMIQKKIKMSPSQQHLLYGSVPLQKDTYLRDYRIPEGGTIQLEGRVRGG